MDIWGALRELHVADVRAFSRHVLLDKGQGLLGVRGIGDGEEGLPVLVIAQGIEKGLERLAVDVVGGVDHDEGYGVDFGLVVERPNIIMKTVDKMRGKASAQTSTPGMRTSSRIVYLNVFHMGHHLR